MGGGKGKGKGGGRNTKASPSPRKSPSQVVDPKSAWFETVAPRAGHINIHDRALPVKMVIARENEIIRRNFEEESRRRRLMDLVGPWTAKQKKEYLPTVDMDDQDVILELYGVEIAFSLHKDDRTKWMDTLTDNQQRIVYGAMSPKQQKEFLNCASFRERKQLEAKWTGEVQEYEVYSFHSGKVMPTDTASD